MGLKTPYRRRPSNLLLILEVSVHLNATMVVCSCLGLKPDTQRKTLWLMLGSLLLSCVFVVIKERHFAREIHRLSPVLTHLVPASCVPSPQNDGVYVHLECPIRNSSTFYPPDNFSKNINPFHGVFFEVKAEMYQYPSFPDFLGRRNPIWADHLVSKNTILGLRV